MPGPAVGAMTSDPTLRPRGRALIRTALRLAIAVVVAWLALWLFDWLVARTASADASGARAAWVLIAMLGAYAVLIAIPFVPGIEIGVALLMMEGGSVAAFVYGATVFGLTLAYGVGRYVPEGALVRVFADLRLRRLAGLLDRTRGLSPARRLVRLRQALPRWIAPLAVGWRYVTLGILLNLPGNALLGGGGGLSLLAGLSRLFAPAPAIATFAIAVAPVPLLVWLFDMPVPALPG